MLEQLGRRIRMRLTRSRFERDFEEEMRLHVELREEQFRAAGTPDELAHRGARLRFGGALRVREDSRDAWGWRWLEQGVALAGIVVGLSTSLMLSPLIANLLYGVAPRDPATFIGAATLLAVAATITTLIGAAGAASVDPIKALQNE